MGDFRFTSEQRGRLAQREVSPTQIEMLEGRACLVGRRAWLRKSPPRTVVSKKIKALGKHLRAAHDILKEISAGNAQECRVAEGLLCEAVSQSGKEVELLDPARLEALACICDDALSMLPIQTRHRADPRPIQWIYEALIRGHGMEHSIVGDGDDGWPVIGTHPPPSPEFTIEPSSSAGSQFREVVGICYEAMTGHRDADPERAIKAFITQREKWEALREVERKKWMGHQVPEKDDLVS